LTKINDDNAYTVDIYDADDAVVDMEIHVTISHPAAPELFTIHIEKPELPTGIKYGRNDDVFGRVYFDLLQHSSIDNFLQDDFLKYLPEEMENVYDALKLPDKTEDA